MASSINIIDLFAGAGGFSRGFELSEIDSYQTSLAIEIDKWASESFEANFPEATVLTEDIRDFVEQDMDSVLPDDTGVIIGGPPCQDFSVSNTHSKEEKHPDESLFRYFIDVVEEVEPPAFVIENVPGIQDTEATTGETILNVVERYLGQLPYEFETNILFAADYGVPQRRERVFFVGVRDDIYDGESLSLERTHIPGKKTEASTDSSSTTNAGQLKLGEAGSVKKSGLKEYWSLWEAISDLPQIEAGENQERYEYPKPSQNEYQELMRDGSEYIYNHVPMNHTDRIIERFKHIDWGESQSDIPEEHAPHIRGNTERKSDIRYDQNNRRLYPRRLSNTITASFYSNFIHPYLHRNFTAREAARIQSFPDTHIFKGKKTTPSNSLLKREGREDEMHMHQYGQVGNAVPPLMAKAIADMLGEILQDYY
jgi:DNA (cytosine-5)-methyltransferase 1